MAAKKQAGKGAARARKPAAKKAAAPAGRARRPAAEKQPVKGAAKGTKPAAKRPAGRVVNSKAKKRAESTGPKRAGKRPPKKAAAPSGRARQAVVKAVAAGAERNGGPLANPLENPRYEQFCQLIHSGVIPRLAAIRVGLSERTASTQASRLLKFVQIQRRLAWLHSQSANRIIARKRDILVAHTADALAGPADFTALIGMDRHEAEAFLAAHPHSYVVREIEIENVAVPEMSEPGGPVVNAIVSRVKRFKLADSMAARRELAKLMDWYARHPDSASGMRRASAAVGGEDGLRVEVLCLGPGESPADLEDGDGDGEAGTAGAGVVNDRLALTTGDEKSDRPKRGRAGDEQNGRGPVIMGNG